MAVGPLDELIQRLARLPGLGPRSARRAALHLLKHRETALAQLAAALAAAAREIRTCSVCGNLDDRDPCSICAAPGRDPRQILVVEDVDDLWAMERAGRFRGRYHVLGGTLSALDGIGPEDLRIERLVARVEEDRAEEVILATSATVDGQTTAHYVAERLAPLRTKVTRLAYGVPIGGELNYLDDGTLDAALRARQPLTGGPAG